MFRVTFALNFEYFLACIAELVLREVLAPFLAHSRNKTLQKGIKSKNLGVKYEKVDVPWSSLLLLRKKIVINVKAF